MAEPSGNSALQETDIGPVPEDWGLARLRELTYEAIRTKPAPSLWP